MASWIKVARRTRTNRVMLTNEDGNHQGSAQVWFLLNEDKGHCSERNGGKQLPQTVAPRYEVIFGRK